MAHDPEPGRPAAVVPIIRDALTHAGPEVRRAMRLVLVFWVVMLGLQVWDSRNGRGAAGVAEFLATFVGISGAGLLGVAHTLQLAMTEATARTPPAGRGAGAARVLLALPVVGFAAGVALGAAALLMVVRGALGAPFPLVAIGVLLYGGLLIVAARTVTRSSQTLYAFAADQARSAAALAHAATAARLEALRARMNPHVLFNALNTVASLVRTDPAAAAGIVEDLADVMRQTLDRSAVSGGTVRQEVDYIRSCLALEQVRWGDRLRVSWQVADAVLDHPMPPFIVQPLVENALRHGVGARLEGGHVRIAIGLEGDMLVSTVSDDGPGFAARWREGTGLGNLRQRLTHQYGDAASLLVGSATPGAEVTVRLPAGQSGVTGRWRDS